MLPLLLSTVRLYFLYHLLGTRLLEGTGYELGVLLASICCDTEQKD